MSAHKFWDSFNFGFLNGMLGSNPLFGCSMPMWNGFSSYSSIFSPLNSFFMPFQNDSMMYLTPNTMFSNSVFPLMPEISLPPMQNFTFNTNNSLFTNWNSAAGSSSSMPMGDFFVKSSAVSGKFPSNSRSSVQNSGSSSDSSIAKMTDNSINDKYFDKMLKFVLDKEGGYSNDTGDSGGKTNKGITQTTYNNYRKKKKLAVQDVRKISNAELRDIYYGIFKECGADRIDNPRMAFMVFDVAVNCGSGRARKMFKESGGSISKFIQLRKQFYSSLAANNSSKRKFLRGWNNRVDSSKEYAMANFPDKSSA